MNWEPPHFKAGDRVIDQEHPEWGEGTVLRIDVISSERRHGQRLNVRFGDGRTRTVATAIRPLKHSPRSS